MTTLDAIGAVAAAFALIASIIALALTTSRFSKD